MRRIPTKSILLTAVFSLLSAACGPGGGGGGDGVTHRTSGSSWTVLVYMVADNNLEPDALFNLQQMANVGDTSSMRFVVQLDRSGTYSADPVPGVGTWSGVKRLLVHSGSSQMVQDLSDVDMGDPATLADFIQWGVKAYPADRYALVLWDHGAAWPGFGDDESHSNHGLNLAALTQGMASGLSAASLKSFSLIGFDACLMGTVEVARALAPYGEYLIASEQLEPGEGWDYSGFKLIHDDPTQGPIPLGKTLIDGFQAQSNSTNDGQDTTLSLTDLYALDDLTKGLDALASAGSGGLPAAATTIGRERGAVLEFGKFPDPSQSFNMVDLADLATRLAGADSSFQSAQTQIQSGLTKAVLYHVNGTATQSAGGLSIYFPPQAIYYDANYDSLAAMANWRNFIKAYTGSANTATAVPTFTNQSHLATTSFPDNGHLQVSGTLATGDGSQVSTATLTYGLQTSSGLILLGDKPAVVSGDQVSATWNLSVLVLSQTTTSGGSQTTNTGYGYLSLDYGQNNTILATIPFSYTAPGQQAQNALRQLVIDSGGNITQDAFYAESNGAYAQLTVAPGATLMPIVQVVDSSGNTSWAAGSNTPFSADNLASQPINLNFSTVLSGKTVFGQLTAANFAGKGDYVYGTAVTP